MNQSKDDLLKDQLTRIKLLLNDLQIKDQQLEILKAKLIDLDEENSLLITKQRMNENSYEENVMEFRRIQRQNIEKIAYLEEKNKDLEYLQNENFLLQEELGRRREEEEKIREENEARREENEERKRMEEEMKNIIQKLEKESELFIEKINALESENSSILTRLADLTPIHTLFEEEKATTNLLSRRIEEMEVEGSRREEEWRREEDRWRRKEEGWEEERNKFELLFYEYNVRLMKREGKEEEKREEGKGRLEGMEEELRILKEMVEDKDQNIEQLRILLESERDSSRFHQSDLQVLLNFLQAQDKKSMEANSFHSKNSEIMTVILSIMTKKLKSRAKYKKSYGKLKSLLVEKEEIVGRLAVELEEKKRTEEKGVKELDLGVFSGKIEELEDKLREKEIEFLNIISQKESEIQSLSYSLSTHTSLLRQKEEEKAELLSILNQQIQANGAYGFTFGHSQMNWEEDEEGRREEDERMTRKKEEIKKKRGGGGGEGGGEGEVEEERRRREIEWRREEEMKSRGEEVNEVRRREEGGRKESGKRNEEELIRDEGERRREESLALAGMVKMMCYLFSLVRRMNEIKEFFKEYLEVSLRIVKKIDKIGGDGGSRKKRMKKVALSIYFLKIIGGGNRRRKERRREDEKGEGRGGEGEGDRRREEGNRRREDGFYKVRWGSGGEMILDGEFCRRVWDYVEEQESKVN